MVIEALINGEVLTRDEIPDEYLEPIPGASWQQNAESRQQIVSLYLEAFKKKMEKVFNQALQVQYCLVFTSKLHLQDDNDECPD
jgi:hypothetical protein